MFCSTILTPVTDKRFIPFVNAEGIASAWHNDSVLSVSIIRPEPRINWYDFQYYDNDSGWVSRLNQKIDVNATYRFVINVSSDQGWDNITYINITAWYDNGTETSNYNDTQGGNFNLHFQYDNTTGSPTGNMFWPTNGSEATFLGVVERNVTAQNVSDRLTNDTETRNITFSFIPGNQFRYAPGGGNDWSTNMSIINTSYYGLFNPYSWNFNITIDNEGGYTSWIADEFGVYRWTEILSAGDPSIIGYPGQTCSTNDAGGSGNIDIVTVSNGNYSLSANISDLTHDTVTTVIIGKSNVSIYGGDREDYGFFTQEVYLYGGGQGNMTEYHNASSNGTRKTTQVEYRCSIPYVLTGTYNTTILYHLRTQE